MKLLKTIPLLSLLSLAVLFSNCKKEEVREDEYLVTVTVLSPTEGATINAGEAFTVNVSYARENNIIHNVTVEIIDKDDIVVEELLKQHAHEQGNYEFKQDGIKINEAGEYRIRAYSTDMDGEGHEGHETGGEEPEHHNMKMTNFTIQ